MSTKLTPREIEELLPWYAAGTLDPAEKAAVEAALAADPELSRKLELTRDEMGEAILDNESLATPSPRALEKLFALIDAEPARKPSFASSLFDLGGRIADWFSPRTLGWALAAAALAIAVQAGFLAETVLRPTRGGSFTTASHPPNPSAAIGTFGTASRSPESTIASGSFLLVAFQPNATAEAISRTLDAQKLTIVDGPRPGGLYRLRIGLTTVSKQEVDRVSAALQAETAVIRMVLPSS